MRLPWHGHGGTLLVVPSEDGDWRNKIVPKYKADSAYMKTSEDVVAEFEAHNEHEEKFLSNRQQCLDLIGRLTAVDGATVITRDFAILGFGAKIDCKYEPDELVRVTNPLIGSEPHSKKKTITDLGGTRHQSAARFVRDNKNSIAVVASQDGKVSLVAWDDEGFISVTEHAEWQLIR